MFQQITSSACISNRSLQLHVMLTSCPLYVSFISMSHTELFIQSFLYFWQTRYWTSHSSYGPRILKSTGSKPYILSHYILFLSHLSLSLSYNNKRNITFSDCLLCGRNWVTCYCYSHHGPSRKHWVYSKWVIKIKQTNMSSLKGNQQDQQITLDRGTVGSWLLSSPGLKV